MLLETRGWVGRWFSLTNGDGRSFPLAAAVLSAGFLFLAPAWGEAQERTTLDGVYTEDQADRGEASFRSFCSNCHIPGEFHGEFFQQRVSGDPVEWLFDYIRFSMPDDSPGSLSRQMYVDIMAYILRLNEYPAGEEELVGTSEALGAIRFPEGL